MASSPFSNPTRAPGRRPLRLRRALLAVVAVAALTSAASAASAGSAGHGAHLLGTWSASPQPPDLSGISRSGFNHQTVRLIAYTHFPGSRLRVRLSNVFGSRPLLVGQADVALESAGAAIVPGSDRRLSFHGRRG